jgi:DNA-binding IclR family transcriptional regulator
VDIHHCGEWHEDLAVASAIWGREGMWLPSASCSHPQTGEENIDPLGRLVMKAAAEISHELGLARKTIHEVMDIAWHF